jgi:hypothetical protein
MTFQDGQKIAQPPDDSLEGGSGPNLQNNDAGALLWGKSQDLAEVAIEGNECSPLS